MNRKSLKIIAMLITVAAVMMIMTATVFADAGIGNHGYPYGLEMNNTTGMDFVVDVTGATDYMFTARMVSIRRYR